MSLSIKNKADHCETIYKQLKFLNYISASSLYLKSNFFLESELSPNDIKPRILGHWGTVPGLNLIYACANVLVKETNQDTMFITGPGHGAPAILSNLFLEGTLTDYYPNITHDKNGAEILIKSFSWPKLFPSHTYPGLPGSIHEGGELGYSLGTAFGSVFDLPDNMSLCVVGDGEAETGALAASWHSNKFLNPNKDGFILPILHINGYKISNPTLFGTMSDEELILYFQGLSYKPIIVKQNLGSEIEDKKLISDLLDAMFTSYEILNNLRTNFKDGQKITLPLILLRTEKGWTGPKFNGDTKIEGNNYSHGIPIKDPKTKPKELKIIKDWLLSYSPENFFTKEGKINKELLDTIPNKDKRIGNNKYAQVSKPKELVLPELKSIANLNIIPGKIDDSSLVHFSDYLNLILKNKQNDNIFRVFSPDESESNLLEKIFETTTKVYQWPLKKWDKNFSTSGKVMEILSEQTLQSWMQGYILTGRNGVLISYEAFLSIIASQIDQYIKFIRQSQDFSWRMPVPSLNYIATSSVWRQDHNGFTHQNPILINTLLAKHVDFVNVYFPCDANSLLVVMEKVFKSKSTVNLIVSGKTKMPQWLTLEQAKTQINQGLMEWEFASNYTNEDIDVVISSAGDYQTIETLAGINVIKELAPEIKFKYINISSLSCVGFGCGEKECMTQAQIESFYTKDNPIIINFHGYPELMKQMLFDTCLVGRTTILGYIEKGTTTTPFDMQVKNLTSRYHVAINMIEQASKNNEVVFNKKFELIKLLQSKIEEHKAYIIENGDDMPCIKNWQWQDNTKQIRQEYDNTNS
jgi:xylulose-5-phosphate/fructose-6-phosphate phosphoketolase